MPELPEVETVRRTLDKLVVGKTISRVEVLLPRIIRRPQEPEAFARALEGASLTGIGRRGKFLQFVLDNGLILLSHLRMEGRYGLYCQADEMEKHTHVRFFFTDGTELRYKDVRQFGTMDLYTLEELKTEGPLRKLGLEPLDDAFTLDAFRKALKGRRTKIKPLLLNQECVAGLGNIYVDEVLFSARIHPETPAAELSRKETERLHEAIRRILAEAVDAGGSSVKSYVNGQGEAGTYQFQLRVYGKEGTACAVCGSEIMKYVVGGRGTHICPRCQKAKKKGFSH
jgi:formamidopyrimidine-DNA glycosylase